MTTYTLGIDIGGTKIAAALMDETGQLWHTRTVPTPARDGAAAILRAVLEAGEHVRAAGHVAGREAGAVGVGSAGLIDHGRGVVMYASDILPGWTGTAIADQLQTHFQLPVVVDNDVNALALGEQHFGAGRELDHVLYLAVGTGIGGAITLNGQLWRGATFSAGEIGHLVIDYDGTRRCACGQMGHLEAYVAGPALALRYRELAGSDAVDLRMVAERAHGGDAVAQHVIIEGGELLGRALGGVLCMLDPQAVVIGGGVAELGTLWWEPLLAAVRATALPGPSNVLIKLAQLGPSAVLRGAAWLAMQTQGIAP